MTAEDRCRAQEVDGELVIVRGQHPMSPAAEAALGDLVRATKQHLARNEPHLAVRQELIAACRAAERCIPDSEELVTSRGMADGTAVKARLWAAVEAASEVLRAPRASTPNSEVEGS